MKINKRKLPIKYTLDVYSEVPGYPSEQDLEYMTVAALEERGLLGVEFSIVQIWDSFKHCLGTIENLRGFMDKTFEPAHNRDSAISGAKPTPSSYIVHDHAWSK